MLPNLRLVGKLVTLRLATVADAETMLAALEPQTTQNLQFFSTDVSLTRQVGYLQRMMLSPSDLLFAIVGNDDGRMIGTIGVHEHDTHLNLGRLGLLIFSGTDRGRGYGNEATQLLLEYLFTQLRLNKVIVVVFATNTRMQHHWTNLGFHQEGVLREEYLLNGNYQNLVRFSLLRREWPHA